MTDTNLPQNGAPSAAFLPVPALAALLSPRPSNDHDHQHDHLALIVGNAPSLPPLALLDRLWTRAKYRICADGGANRLFDLAPHLTPHALVGDLDSARPDVLAEFRNRGTQILGPAKCQNSTDLMKCLAVLAEWDTRDQLAVETTVAPCRYAPPAPPRAMDAVDVALVGFAGGRADHALAVYSTILAHVSAGQVPGLRRRITLVDGENAVTVLPAGRYKVPVPSVFGPHCGIVPLDGPVYVRTQGLAWDLTMPTRLRMGGLVSACNMFSDAVDQGTPEWGGEEETLAARFPHLVDDRPLTEDAELASMLAPCCPGDVVESEWTEEDVGRALARRAERDAGVPCEGVRRVYIDVSGPVVWNVEFDPDAL
ncbi:cAMP-dependent protein kinase subunit [Allomyces javanicus]|nr:cAMP-dependent protein kinase subunit [Allomyces javanicus]